MNIECLCVQSFAHKPSTLALVHDYCKAYSQWALHYGVRIRMCVACVSKFAQFAQFDIVLSCTSGLCEAGKMTNTYNHGKWRKLGQNCIVGGSRVGHPNRPSRSKFVKIINAGGRFSAGGFSLWKGSTDDRPKKNKEKTKDISVEIFLKP